MTTVQRDASIGPYPVIRRLGSGGMGEVFLAYDTKLDRHIAVKVLPENVAGDPALLNRLRREARLTSGLNHPNIVTVYDISEGDGFAYVAMEHIDGRTLRELTEEEPLPIRKVLQIAAQVANGLSAAHKRGVVHRDLKPENVMVTGEGLVKILDFGLAKAFAFNEGDEDSAATISREGVIAGTCSYMSPEQARGQVVDFRSDQFSFGAMLYELLSGNKPFEGESAVETLFAIVRDEPPSLASAAPHVPPPLRWIVERCMAKDPEERYASTQDLARDLNDLRDHFSEASFGAVKIAQPEAKGVRAAMAIPLLILVLAIGLAIGLAATKWTDGPDVAPITSFDYLTYSGLDYSPAASPDGKLIAFSSQRDGNLGIWLKQINGGGEVALTPGPSDDFPRFSPDGSWILYRGAAPRAALLRISTVGGEPRKLIDDATSGDWSPEGRRLAFTRPVGGSAFTTGSLHVANADGTGAKLLARFPMPVIHPRWSPDGRTIAVIGARGRSMLSVVLVDAASGAWRTLAAPPKAGDVSSVVWSTDSKAIYYVRAESVETVVGSSALIYRHDLVRDEAGAIGWSPRNAMVLDRLIDGTMIFDTRSPSDNLREIALDAKPDTDRWLTRGSSSDRQPVYSPDGKTILFSSTRSGNLDLWQISTETGVVRRITDDAAEDWDPAFTSDGKIVWSSGRSGNLEIWMADADGGNARQISRDGVDAENPSPTPDGKWIVYNSFHPEKHGLWRVNADGSSAVRLVAGRTAIPEVSPDGQHVVVITDSRLANPSLRVVRVADGKDMGFSIPLRTKRRTSAIIGRARWMPDGRAIAFIGQDEEGVNGVFVQDFVPGRDTTATRRKLGGFDPYRSTESFGISPDGRRLTVAGWEQLFSIMAVRGLGKA